MIDSLRAVAVGGLIALAGVLIGQLADDLAPEARIVVAVVLALLAVALGVDVRRYLDRRVSKEEEPDVHA